jgi:hypothetical protein
LGTLDIWRSDRTRRCALKALGAVAERPNERERASPVQSTRTTQHRTRTATATADGHDPPQPIRSFVPLTLSSTVRDKL